MAVSARSILLLIALLLVNGGLGRALHAYAEHGHECCSIESVSTELHQTDTASTPGSDGEECRHCELIRAGSDATTRSGEVVSVDLDVVERLVWRDRDAHKDHGADAARPRGPPTC